MTKGYPGYLITLEGGEGGGKTTVAKRCVEWLRKMGVDAIDLREPGGTEVGEQIGSILRDMRYEYKLSRLTEALLFQAARSQLTDEVLIPNLSEGKIVMLDRFIDSTIAYQGSGRELNVEWLESLNRISTRGIIPDLTLLLDVPVEVGLERKRGASVMERIDKEGISFHRRVRQAYLKMCEENPGRWVKIDASRSKHEVFGQIRTVIEGRLIASGFIEREKRIERLG